MACILVACILVALLAGALVYCFALLLSSLAHLILVAWSLAVHLAGALVYGLHISCLHISCLHICCSTGFNASHLAARSARRSGGLLRSCFFITFSSHSCCLVIGCSSGWRSGLWLAY